MLSADRKNEIKEILKQLIPSILVFLSEADYSKILTAIICPDEKEDLIQVQLYWKQHKKRFTICHSLGCSGKDINSNIVDKRNYLNRKIRKFIKSCCDDTDTSVTQLMMCKFCTQHKQTCKKCDCKSAVYCSKECQKKDWSNHKEICKKLRGK